MFVVGKIFALAYACLGLGSGLVLMYSFPCAGVGCLT
jgi:hypothetical protein